MDSNRTKLLLGVAGVLLALVIWNWISGWGLVTVHVKSQPLAKVIRSIESQGRITIVTNADLTAPVSMDVDRVPATDAVDVLSAAMDGNWSVGYVAGPSKADVTAGIAALTQGGRSADFRMFGLGGGFGGGMADTSDTVIDARKVVWNVSAADTPQLQSYLDQLSQKTGLMAMVPQTWNPSVAKQPSGGNAASALRAIVGSVGGQYEEIFVIRVFNQNRVADNGGGQNRQPGTDGGFGGGGGPGGGGRGGRGDFHPEWIAERAQARIALLPKDEQADAKKHFDDMRAMFDKIRALPQDQRQAAMQALFNSDSFQQQMADRMASRDEKSGPEKRADRARTYIQHKAQMQAQAQGKS